MRVTVAHPILAKFMPRQIMRKHSTKHYIAIDYDIPTNLKSTPKCQFGTNAEKHAKLASCHFGVIAMNDADAPDHGTASADEWASPASKPYPNCHCAPQGMHRFAF